MQQAHRAQIPMPCDIGNLGLLQHCETFCELHYLQDLQTIFVEKLH